MLTCTAEELYAALKEMGPTKAPGYDGFPAIFFQNFWHIVGKEITNLCLEILNNGASFGNLNHTDIVLIPKVPNPTSIVNFRPISLCSVITKWWQKQLQLDFKQLMEDALMLLKVRSSREG